MHFRYAVRSQVINSCFFQQFFLFLFYYYFFNIHWNISIFIQLLQINLNRTIIIWNISLRYRVFLWIILVIQLVPFIFYKMGKSRIYYSLRGNFGRERDSWPTDIIEIRALFELLYIADLLQPNCLNTLDLWDTIGLYVEVFSIVISWKQFLFLLWYLMTVQPGHKDCFWIILLLKCFCSNAKNIMHQGSMLLLMKNWKIFVAAVVLFSIFLLKEGDKGWKYIH